LIYSILHGRSSEFNNYYQTEFNRYEALLNSAPECGTYNFGKNTTYNSLPPRPIEWSVMNRLVWPESLDSDGELGYSNGIDYMLLHNVFWLAYIVPETIDSYSQSGYTIPFSVNNITYGDQNNPIVVNVRNLINYSCTINSTGVVKLAAGSGINLLPGFSAESGSIFTAQNGTIIPIVNKVYPIYKKLSSSNNCLTISY
jgi:hypothetical protein